MSKITKLYWQWNEKYNLTDYKLGEDISHLLSEKKILKIDDINYSGIDEFPYSITTVENKITSIFYSRRFPESQIINWTLKEQELVDSLDTLFERSNVDEKGDKLFIVFRDFYVAFVGFIGGPSPKGRVSNGTFVKSRE